MNSNDVSRLYYLVNSLVAAPHDYESLMADVLAGQPRDEKFKLVVGELKKRFDAHVATLGTPSTLGQIVEDLTNEGREEARFAAVALREALSMMENQSRRGSGDPAKRPTVKGI